MITENKDCILFDNYENIDCISIISIDRVEHNYIYKTLQNIFFCFTDNIYINIYIGNEHTEYLNDSILQNYLSEQQISRINKISISPEYLDKIKDYNVYLKGKFNYARALCHYNGNKGLIIFEDDIDVTNNMLDIVEKVTNFIKEKENKYILCLYDRWHDKKTDNFKISYVGNDFSCTQGMYYTNNVTNELWLDIIELDMPYDIAIHQCSKMINIPLLYMVPSLVQHEGIQTTGLSCSMHTSTSFNKDTRVENIEIV